MKNYHVKFSKEKIIVTHIGSVGINHHIESFMKAISKLDSAKYEFRFIGRLTDEVINLINKFIPRLVILVSRIKHNELEALRKAIVSVFPGISDTHIILNPLKFVV